ncbi:MAG: glycoside hydrolase family 9 protein [Cyanobacteria bacterium P01_G01_bin.19]
MNFRLNNSVLLVVLGAAIVGILFSLDSDRETLLRAGVTSKKPAIVVNQIGYLPSWGKKAFFRQNTLINPDLERQERAKLIDRDTDQEVASLDVAPAVIDPESADAIATIDFSDFTQPGSYYLRAGKFQSVPFAIGTDIYQDSLVKLLRSYYTQRCGVAIADPISGISHPPCHVKDAIVANRENPITIDAVGGWHDGGSYNKYVATTTAALGRLLSLYEQNPDLFPDSQLSIPESGNGRSDLLDEMEFGLNWLLKMQRDDGAVYRKVAGDTWGVNLAPEEDVQPRYVYGISTPATAKFAATMAIASRNFESIDPQLSREYLDSAKLAWQYLQTQTEMKVDWQESDDSGSDKYLASEFNTEKSLTTDVDDRLWAAAELYITTGDNNFANYFADNLNRVEYTLYEWKNPAPLGMIHYLRQSRQPTVAEVTQQIETKLLVRADLILDRIDGSAYNLANDRFIWGSNRMFAEEAITLVNAYKITNNAKYFNAAIEQLDYLLGRNHFNQTFITDIGTNPVQNLSNLYARAKQIKFPGLVVSGANAASRDGRVFKNKGHLSYRDDELSYATNGNATDYNASVISLIVNLIEVTK